MKALIFDCDGVLVDTERDGHRVAFNRAFADAGLQTSWDVDVYGELLKIAGGKERIKHYFETTAWPRGQDAATLVPELHKRKTAIFTELVASGRLPLRPGVARIVDEAHAAGIRLGVCTTSDPKSVGGVLDLLGPQRKAKFEIVLAGDVVSKKKPDPEIYNLAKQRLGLNGRDCVVIEDSRNGLLAAVGAG
ncbi:MAG TPA: HAD-IA family hydrolase, partial [Gammaproteobacteria bacterium]|nr:HAD-IA family hydrolase [Gammaproteobacteria bacterium]